MAVRYEIRVVGALDKASRAALDDLEPEAFEELSLTVITGEFDQPQLHGLLERLRYLRLDLDDVRRVASSPTWTGSDP